VTPARPPGALRRRAPRATLLASLALASTASSLLAAPTPLDAPEQAEANFVFAHRLGSGIYELSGRTLQIYRLPIEWRLREPTPTRPGLTLTLPVTFGFFDFRVQDVIETGLPTSLSTVSFVPGLRWEYRLDDFWRVEPFVEAGVARDNASDLRATVSTVGARAEWRGETRWGMGRYVAAVSYAHADTRGLPTDDFGLVTHSAQVTHPLQREVRGRRLQAMPYASLRWFADPPATPLTAGESRGGRAARLQAEVGVTFGTVTPLRLGRVALPPVGVGYRFGDDLSVFRIVIGQPF
jgi:hypothetical protein